MHESDYVYRTVNLRCVSVSAAAVIICFAAFGVSMRRGHHTGARSVSIAAGDCGRAK